MSLITVVYEKLSNISSERNTQYEVYESSNLQKLDISVCKDSLIDIYVPLTLSQDLLNLYEETKDLGYDLFNLNNKFYQDICTPYKSSNGADILLSDRIDYYYNNDETRCQSNCNFSDYLIESKYLKCKCDDSNSEINTKDSQKFNTEIIYKSFYDVLKFSNYKVLKCYKLAFTRHSLTKNIGSIIILIFIFIYIIFIILYLIKGNNEIKKKLIIIKNNNNNKIKEFKNTMKIKENNNILKGSSIKNDNKKKKRVKNNNNTLPKKEYYPPKKIKLNKDSDIKILFQNKNNNKIIIDKASNSNNSFIKKIKKFNDIDKEKMDNYELNHLEYEQAIKFDKRKFCEIYWSLLNRKQIILFTFFNPNDFNIIYIKFAQFIFLICTDMALNVFFFADETMHKMFLDYGKYDIVQQIPQIIYSNIVSIGIQILINFFSLTDKNFYEIKCKKLKKMIREIKIVKCIKLKLNFFILFTFIMLTFYWYTVTCFCSVYKNTQIAFIKDSFLSFCLLLLNPFILYLFPSLLRIISLKFHMKRLLYIFKVLI